MLPQVRRRDHRRAHRGRGQVDGPDPRGLILRRRVPVHVGAGRLEHQVGLLRLRQQPVDTLVRGLQTQLAGPGQALALRVDAHHPARLQPVRPQQFVQQVGADISRPDNGHTCLRGHRTLLIYSNDNRTEPRPVEVGEKLVSSAGVDRSRARSGKHHVALSQPYPEAFHLAGQPRHRGDRIAQHRVAAALGDDLAVAGQHRVDGLDVEVARRDPGLTQHKTRRRGVVGDGVAQRDLPVGDPGVDQLDGRHQGLGRRQHVVLGAARSGQVLGQDEADLDLDPRIQKAARLDRGVLEDLHLVEQMPVVRLVDPHHLLHRQR